MANSVKKSMCHEFAPYFPHTIHEQPEFPHTKIAKDCADHPDPAYELLHEPTAR